MFNQVVEVFVIYIQVDFVDCRSRVITKETHVCILAKEFDLGAFRYDDFTLRGA